LLVGSHDVNYKAISGWAAPQSKQVNITDNNTTEISGNYRQLCNFGSFDGQRNVKLTLKDCNNNDVTFSLSGGGYGEMYCDDCNFLSINLYNTNEKSKLTISTKNKTGSSVGSIICNGPLKSIVARNTGLHGSIVIGSPAKPNPNAAVMIGLDQASDLSISSEMPIKTLSATEWLGGSINAPSVGSITTKGDKKRSIAGDLDVNVALDGSINSAKVAGTLSGEWSCDSIGSVSAMDIVEANLILSKKPDLNIKILALGKLTAKVDINNSQVLSTGHIGTVSAAKIVDSSCFAGVVATSDLNGDGVLDLPDPNLDANQINYIEPATIKKIAIKGIKGEPYPYYINSNIAAAHILSATPFYPEYDNGGIPFGLSAGFIKALKIKDVNGTESWKNLDEPNDSLTFDDFQIRLY
jgi:hypothetical protein